MPVSKIDLDKCIGCGTCVESCPMDVFRLDTVVEYRRSARPAAWPAPWECGRGSTTTCWRWACSTRPRRSCGCAIPCRPSPGRLCPHPCETECTRTQDRRGRQHQRPRAVSRRLSARARAACARPGRSGGAGGGRSAPVRPGLAAAYFLALDGYRGDRVREGRETRRSAPDALVPAFRLPEEVVDAQIDFYRKMGIGFRTGVQVGVDVTVDGSSQGRLRARWWSPPGRRDRSVFPCRAATPAG